MSEPVPERVETTDVADLMRPLYREHDEPRDGFEPVPVWMAIIFGVLFFWGGWYAANHTSDFRADVFDQPNPHVPTRTQPPQSSEEIMELGRTLYAQCAICHQADGTGLDGVHPPLKDAEWVIGAQATPERLIRLTLYGGTGEYTVKGAKYTAPMPAYGNLLRDHELAAILTYIRASWGHQGTPITTEQVRQVRTAEAGRATNGSKPFTMAELLKK